ncbi:DUF4142 domain-containing protein [Noviherbaspirillum massiliense]|uniref:DUF4142 domain-containing protein n=1 Tax=Noviherbaspirillum massiliense TaxID=1465823 RepID=UPI0002DAA4B5|nr:DUF4142 domain-containing protein [Noviherbaspirillum massiliense]
MAHVNPVQIQKFLKGVDYPANKATLIENAKTRGADENVCASLDQLPDEEFQTPADVSQAFGRMLDEPARSAYTSGGSEFLAQALQDSLAEIELCEMALQKTTNQDIKMFAQRMIEEHGQMGQEIERHAGRMKFALPKDVSSEQQSTAKDMSRLSGADFDRKFMEHNAKDHEKDVKAFRHYAEQESDAEIKSFAEKSARTLSQHLDTAKDISRRLQA